MHLFWQREHVPVRILLPDLDALNTGRHVPDRAARTVSHADRVKRVRVWRWWY